MVEILPNAEAYDSCRDSRLGCPSQGEARRNCPIDV
jgi:hypothetical protein